MTSILRQERLTSFAAGVGATTALYVFIKRHILNVTEDTLRQLPGVSPRAAAVEETPTPLLGATARAWAVQQWNEGVDAVFKPIVQALSKRNL